MEERLKKCQDHISNVWFQSTGTVDHLTLPFVHLLEKWIPDIVLHNGTCTATCPEGARHNFVLTKPRIVKDLLSPCDAIVFFEDYTATLHCTVTYDVDGKQVEQKEIQLCKIPLMVGAIDPYEHGQPHPGCFITHGKLKFMPTVKSVIPNFPLLVDKHKVQVRSLHLDKPFRSTSTIDILIKDGSSRNNVWRVFVKISFLDPLIPISIIVTALGFSIQTFIHQIVTIAGPDYSDETFKNFLIFLHVDGPFTKASSLEHVARDMGGTTNAQRAENMLKEEVLPHLNNSEDVPAAKLLYLAYLFTQLVLLRSGVLQPTVRDCRENVRLVDPATSIAHLFRVQFLLYMRHATKHLRKSLLASKQPDLAKMFAGKIPIVAAIASGKFSSKKVGMSQNIVATNAFTVEASLRSIQSDIIRREGKFIEPRLIHSSQFGYECACETPHGHDCGLRSTLACTAGITRQSDSAATMSVIHRAAHHLLVPVTIETGRPSSNASKVFDPNGAFVFWCTDTKELVEIFYDLKRTLAIDPTTSCKATGQEIRFFADAGRFVRPLLVAKKWQTALKLKNLSDMLVEGCIDFISPCDVLSHIENDPNDLEKRFVAVAFREDAKATHYEITDVSFVGNTAAKAPFFTHNQGPRTVYHTNMEKQLISARPVPEQSAASTRHQLWYGQRPMIQTKTATQLGQDSEPAGMNCIVALLPMPTNQEDAIIISKSSIERGMGICSSFRKYTVETKVGNRDDRKFENPLRSRAGLPSSTSYDAIGPNGMPKKKHTVSQGDVVIGMSVASKKQHTSTTSRGNVSSRVDASITAIESGTVVGVEEVKKPTGAVKTVTCETVRHLQPGDKMASRHAQKGVVSVAIPQEDMPFSEETGMSPDLVMNPIGITSRMTMGLVLELMCGKAGAIGAEAMGDDQDFHGDPDKRIRHIQKVLLKAGFSSSGKEIFICGKTGERIRAPVMCGVVFYMRLQHFAASKAYARSTGPMNPLTRQPVDGRKAGGGPKLGWMEFSCIFSAGVGPRERCSASDGFQLYVCRLCGNIADGNRVVDYFYCRSCRTSEGVCSVDNFSFSNVVMFHELNATGIKLRFALESKM